MEQKRSSPRHVRGYIPLKKKWQPRLFKALFFLTLSASLIIALVLVSRQQAYQAAQQEYEQYRELALEAAVPVAVSPENLPTVAPTPTQVSASPAPSPTGTPAPSPQPQGEPFFSRHVSILQKENKDTAGWLDILETTVQYPIVQCENNEFYVTHTFQKKENPSGAIFMDCWNVPDFTDFNTVIYGHNMKDGSMFHSLRSYDSQSFADEHRTIEVTLLHQKHRYRVFAAYVSQGEDTADFRGFSRGTDAEKRVFLREIRRRSAIFSTAEVGAEDRMLTLATCTSGNHDWYFVVHAVLVDVQTTEPLPVDF